MDIDIRVVDSEKELLSPCWYSDGYRQKVIDRKTFYVYRFTDKGIILFVVDGLKTDPPLSPILFDYHTEEYKRTYTIPKGIIHTHHSDYLDPDHLEKMEGINSLYVALERNDEVAIDKYKEFILDKIRHFKSLRREASHSYYTNNKEVKKYESLINNIK